MKLFIDSARLSEIKPCLDTGLISGITSNPSLMTKASEPFEKAVSALCQSTHHPVSLQVLSQQTEDMIQEAKTWAGLFPNAVAKLPLTQAGLQACVALRTMGIRVNLTLCFSPQQALLAALAGATYVSIYLGRVDDIGYDSLKTISEVRNIYDRHGYSTQILVASVRHPTHVLESAKVGADIATIAPSVFWKLFEHPLTHLGLKQFEQDWKNHLASESKTTAF